MVCTGSDRSFSEPWPNSFWLKISLYFCAVRHADYLSTVRVINKSPAIAKFFDSSYLEMPNLAFIKMPVFLNRLHPKPELRHSISRILLFYRPVGKFSFAAHIFCILPTLGKKLFSPSAI